MKKRWFIVLFILGFIFLYGINISYSAKYEGKRIREVKILGNKFIATSLIKGKLKTKEGAAFNEGIVNRDVERLYESKLFEKVSVDVKEVDGEVVVSFVVKENPVLKDIVFVGNKRYKAKRLERLMQSRKGEILNPVQIKRDVEKIKEFYEKKGYSSVKIEYETSIDQATNRAVVTIEINEGKRMKIGGIKFEGVKKIKKKELYKIMRTKKATLFTSGILKEEVLEEDLDRIISLYRSKGFLDAKISGVNREYSEQKGKVYLVIKVSEGNRYYVGKVSIQGNKVVSEEKLLKVISLKEGDIFSAQKMEKDLAKIREYYNARGYINAEIRGNTRYNETTGRMDVYINIQEGQKCYVRDVRIVGNTRTKDNVIRRELTVVPGDICDSVSLRKSRKRLQNLGYFKYVDISLVPTEDPTLKDVLVEVEEQKTGEISFGAGYSSIDYLIGFAEISQKNFDITNFPSFVGGGQKLRLRVEAGAERQDYILSFTEPWFMGKRLLVGFDLFARESRFLSQYFDEKRTGGDIRMGFGLGQYSRVDMRYTYQQIKITNVSSDASFAIREEEGTRDVGSLGIGLSRDTRDSWIFPTRGYRIAVTPEIAGLGGDTKFLKLTASGSIYIPLWYKHILSLGVRGGIVDEYGDNNRVPIFDRFFLGGARTVRGFDYRAISPRDENNEPIGGKTMGMASVEYTFPLVNRVRGATFFDIGGVFPEAGEFDLDQLNGAVGIGVRLNLPIGPIRIDYGIPVIKDDYNKGANGRLSFNMGSAF